MAQRLGKISFQSNDKADVFLVLEAWEDGIEPPDEMMADVSDTQFENDRAWVTGKVPRMHPVNISGNTTIVQAWFKGEEFNNPFYLKVYLECEVAETLEGVALELTEREEQERIAHGGYAREKQQQEIHPQPGFPTATHEHFY